MSRVALYLCITVHLCNALIVCCEKECGLLQYRWSVYAMRNMYVYFPFQPTLGRYGGNKHRIKSAMLKQ